MVHSDTLYQRYQVLHEAAEALGDPREAGLVRRRMQSFDQPFTLLVTGKPGAGKSTIIDQVAGKPVAAPVAGQRWTNIYRRFRGTHPYAVVHFHAEPSRGQILPIERARQLAVQAAGLSPDDPASVEQIAWYVDAPGLPEHVTLMEAPLPETEGMEALVGQADAVLLALRADQIVSQEVRAVAAHLEGIQAMAVVTHMDRVPNERVPDVVRQIRVYARPHLDRVITLSAHPAYGEAGLQQASGPLRREVQKRFFASAQEIRAKNHVRILDGATGRLTRRFETLVDRVAADRWTYLAFERSSEEAMQIRAAALWREGEAFLDELQAWAHERGSALERGETVRPELAPRPLPVFFRGLEAGFLSETRRILAGLRYSESGAASKSATAVPMTEATSSPEFPAMTSLPLAVLRGDVALTGQEAGAAVRHFRPDTGLLETGAPQHAAVWQQTQDWIELVVAQAARALRAWITSACEAACGWLRARAADLFRAIHGFGPSEAAASVVRMEGHYMRLTGETTLVRTPHLKQGWMSPALLLFKLQDEGFIRSWNLALARYAYPTVMTQACSRLRERIDRLRGAALDEWAESKAEVAHDAAPLLKRLSRREIVEDRLTWPETWLPAPLPLRMAVLPEGHPPRGKGADPAYEGCASLFLRNSPEGFLAPSEKPAGSPEALALAALQEEIAPELATLWPAQKPVEMPLGVRPAAARYLAGALALLAVLSTAAVLLFGTGGTVLILLAAGLILGAVAAARIIERLVRKRIEAARIGYSEALHRTIREQLSGQFDRLQQRLDALASSREIREILELAMLNRQAQPAPVYMPYGELVRRLAHRKRAA